MKRLRRTSLFLLAALALLPLGAAAQDADPWATLKSVRQSLVDAGPTGANFVQTFTAAGFSSGDQESGRLALSLPDCMRWDYTNPFPKSFLLCGGTVHAWNEGDQTGHRYRVDRKKEPGLDLLLLGVDELKSRYQATAKAGRRTARSRSPSSPRRRTSPSSRTRRSRSTPRAAGWSPSPITTGRGTSTRFEITGYQDLARQGSFSPPGGLRWVDGTQ